MSKLYEFPPTRSQRAKWALEELEIDYTGHVVNLREGEQNQDAYRDIHPLGVVPTWAADAYTIYESVAIVMQLIDENPNANLAPAMGSPDRAIYYQWCVFACAEIDPCLMMFFDNSMRPLQAMRPPGSQYDPKLAERGARDFVDRAKILSNALEGKDYLLGSDFSGADIIIGHSCFMATFMGQIEHHPVLVDYFERLQQRPAYQRAYRD